jgi:competence protein ComEC
MKIQIADNGLTSTSAEAIASNSPAVPNTQVETPAVTTALRQPLPIGAGRGSPVVPAAMLHRRSPAVPVALAFALGILADHLAEPELPFWLILCGLCLAIWGVCLARRWPAAAAVFLLASALTAGAGWHHWRWSIVHADHISRFASEDPQPARLFGRLVDQPWSVPRKPSELPLSIPQFDRTLATLECRELISATRVQPVSGRVRLEVSGQLLQAAIGDEVEVVGLLSRPTGPRNPGAFDFRRYLRSDGLLASIQCGEPEDVRVVHRGENPLRRWQSRWRARAEQMLQQNLSERTGPVGVALLLGTRTAIPEELRTAFAESGTMHILAISGSNVGILAGLLWGIAHLAGLGRKSSVSLILTGILAYSFVADAQPPVMRAVLMIVALLAGLPWHRQGSMVNGLALAALGVLAWNPAHLFDVGAQLSFLAVAALIWAPTWSTSVREFASPPAELAAGPARPLLSRCLRSVRRAVVTMHVTIAAVWLFTLPLTIARFHLVSPVGFFVNVVLAPLVVVILWCGYALLLVGLVAPPLAAPFAFGFDASLRLMLWLIERAAAIKGGHLYLPGPSDGWLAGFYACLAAVAFGLPGGRVRCWGWRAMLIWIVGGLGWSMWPHRADQLRCTFLSVGHGLAVVAELPGGRTLVYDAGQMHDGTRAMQTVQSALWQRGLHSVDALVISHADIDHFNGVPGLARTLAIGAVLVHESFLDFRQPGVEVTCELLTRQGVPIKLIRAGDRVGLDPEVRLSVLHPPSHDRLPTDNANSLVLEIEYAGRSILLTGDLERDGLEYVLRQSPRKTDIFLAPHHGRVAANPRRLAEWANPDWIIVSDGRQDNSDKLGDIYGPGTHVLSTQKSGAITFVIDSRGGVRCEPFRPERRGEDRG